MKRISLALGAVVYLALASSSTAQLGINMFSKPNIANIFKPVVGNGAAYEMVNTSGSGAPTTIEMTVVAKDSFEGREAYWLETSHTERKTGEQGYSKMLITKDDFQTHRMIMQQPGKPAMEFPMNLSGEARERVSSDLEKWHDVGMEPVTVPAGTFLCHHWKKEGGEGDVWASDKVSPLGMVKSVTSGHTMTLVKVITGASDHITGPVTTFDMQKMREQRMEERKKQQQP